MQALHLDNKLVFNKETIEATNLCDRFTSDDLVKIGMAVSDGFERDDQSRSKWMTRSSAAMDLALQIQKEKNFPWPKCANVIFPLVTISSLQFSARAYGSIVQGADVVRYRTINEDTDGKIRERADRISTHMSWQVLEEDTAWEEQHDRLLINLAIVGCNFVKTRFDPKLGHNVSELVMARDLVLDYYAKSVEAASRKTHIVPLYRNDIYERCASGIFRDVREEVWFHNPPPLEDTQSEHDNRQGIFASQPDEDTPYQTLEQHRSFDFDGDGYAEPYIVTIEKSSKDVLRIVARVESEADVDRDKDEILCIRPIEYFTKFSFIPSPDGGIYDVGFGILLGPLNESVNSGINQLLDSGTMQNSMGGFLGRGAKIRGGQYTMAPWEWKRVDSTGDDLRKSLVPYPERAPSVVMFQLLGLLIDYSDRVAGTVDQMVGKTPGQNTPAETSRNALEQGMQVYSMIFKRVWRALKEEFKKLHKLNARYLPTSQRFGSSGSVIRQEDYKSNSDLVVPVADPNITSASGRFFQAQSIREAAMQVPGYDVPEVERNFLRALKVDGIKKLYPGPDSVPPLPNPKAAVEQLKLQGIKMKLDNERQQHIIDLLTGQRKLNAEIALLEAQAIAAVAGADSASAAVRIKAFDSAINALKTQSDVMNERLKTMKELSDDGDSKPNGGGTPGLESKPDQPNLLSAPQGMGTGAEGSMGGGTVQ